MLSKRKEDKRKRKKGGENKRMCSQKTWSDQTHAMVGKSAQSEKMINRARTKNPTQVDPATNSIFLFKTHAKMSEKKSATCVHSIKLIFVPKLART